MPPFRFAGIEEETWCVLRETLCKMTMHHEALMREQVYHSDPEIMGGTPVFTGTRVPVQTLLDYLEGGETINEFLDGFPSVSREQAIAFLDLAKQALLST